MDRRQPNGEITAVQESLEFIYLLSGFEEEEAAFALEQVFLAYEKFEIKDQTSSISQAKKLLPGAVQQPNIVASKFKCLKGLDTEQPADLLGNLTDGKLSFAELKEKAVENWSEEKLKSTLRRICGLNTRLKMTDYIIVVRERDESLTQTLEECTPGGKVYTVYVAWSRMSA
ncbi:hypothetical protein AWC38_SpisGene6459 [Stylophora pistillata]|uniref:Uncharacterized protein n=1 Tax=Stylophora pistillata TaxID=50429 RepID=A0A2B4SG48_STYPI|nr:hypothetical protein AWC38_SpisGene6459 [Stylophora pistillata]